MHSPQVSSLSRRATFEHVTGSWRIVMSKTPSYVLYERVRLGERLRITSIDAACGLLACATGTASVCVTARVVVHARVYS